ncbi:MAG: hypothetical protein RLQ12_09475 [Cyclobacteriaceae bacterium]
MSEYLNVLRRLRDDAKCGSEEEVMMAIKNYPVGTSEHRIAGISTDRAED